MFKEKIMKELKDKVVLVTGASRGIGQYISQEFAGRGSKVVCVARTMSDGEHPLEGSLTNTVEQIRSLEGEATALSANISDFDQCEQLIEQAKSIYGPIDILVNNAALTYFVPVRQYVLKKWIKSWEVNLHAPFYLSHLVLEDMITKKEGCIVNISSAAAVGPGSGPYEESQNEDIQNKPRKKGGGTCYGAQKAALERFTQGLAEEVYEYGISVTCVSPSLVVPTPGTVFHNLVTGFDDPKGEQPELMAKATVLLAELEIEKISGRVTYSQEILNEFGLLDNPKGRGVDPTIPVSGFSRA
jgi:NAD(P)-dependent dehydrogenase (short-subunit alcohol dehydrogenase family)